MLQLGSRHRAWVNVAAAVVVIACFAGPAAGGSVFGPIRPYESFSDSPFSGQSFGYFYLETFESGALAAPGVTASPSGTVLTGFEVDSVEPLGGPTTAGHSLFGDGPIGIRFTFDAGVLGALPTSAAIAWTDGFVPITFQ